tara:strand:+ start:17 stop:265 length:249 start_codon:yes stop_codon:yes gene_type:complete
MVTTSQTPKHNSYTVNARLDNSAYTSMISLMNAAGYSDISSFVREAVLVKCKDIANDVAVMMEDRVIDNKYSKYRPVEYLAK